MTYAFILVGTGGRGAHWCRHILPPFLESGRIDVVAAVDIEEDHHQHAIEHLAVPEEHCYTAMEEAFAEHSDADCCGVVTPPWIHEDVVDLACEYGMDIISEKPIADTLEASCRIAKNVENAGLKMGVTMSHRYDQDKTTFRREINRDRNGPLDYLVGRFTCNAREYGDWGAFRHDIEDPLLVDGAVHQLDFLADMAGAPCETLYCDSWQPEWAEYAGDCQALVQMRFENGVRSTWEGAKANAHGLNGWGSDYIRAEARDATVVLNAREIVRHPYDADNKLVGGANEEMAGEPVDLLERDDWSDIWIVEQFLDWLDGGEKMATNVEDNLQSVALVEAAVSSSNTGEPVDVQALLKETKENLS